MRFLASRQHGVRGGQALRTPARSQNHLLSTRTPATPKTNFFANAVLDEAKRYRAAKRERASGEANAASRGGWGVGGVEGVSSLASRRDVTAVW